MLSLVLLAAAAAAQERTIWAVVLNGIPQDDSFLITSGNDRWIPVRDLIDMALVGFAGERREFGGVVHVRLGSLQPDLVATFDASTVTMTLTATPKLFSAAQLTAFNQKPAGIQYLRTFSSFLNYRVLWNSEAGSAGGASAGLSFYGHSLQSSVAWSDDGSWRRGFSTLALDMPSRKFRAEIGEMSLRGVGGLAGVRVGREYTLDPYYLPYFTPTIAGEAPTASTGELFVDGRLQRSFDLLPGTFTIGNLPVTSGRGQILVRVRDATGRVQDFTRSYYLNIQTLRRGEQDFSYAAGVRLQEGQRGPIYRYDDWVASAGHRIGVSNSVTLGGRVEGDTSGSGAGITVNGGAGPIGEFGIEVAASRSREGQTGSAATLAWQHISNGPSLSANAQWFSRQYRQLGENPADRRRDWNGGLSIGLPLGRRASAFVRASAEELVTIELPPIDADPLEPPTVARSTVTRAGAGLDVRFGPFDTHLTGFWNRDITAQREWWEASLGVIVALGRGVSASVEARRDEAGEQTGYAEVSRPMPRGTGVGFRLKANAALDRPRDIVQANRDIVQADVEAQNSHVHLAIRHQRSMHRDGKDTTSAFLEGGIAQVGRSVGFSRPLTGSFGLVRVPGIRSVTVYQEHTPIGRTGQSGTFLVPDLEEYYGNIIGIESTDVPLEYAIERVDMIVAPPYRGGAAILFPVRRIRGFSGKAYIAGTAPDQRYGEITITRGALTATSPLGADGAFYFENVEPGAYDAAITTPDRTCTTKATLPDVATLVATVPDVVCRPAPGADGSRR